MRLNGKRAARGGESGSFWLSFSDMMSVMVLIFIFVIFAMMYTLEQTKEGLVKLQNEYTAAMTELDTSKEEQQRLIVLLSDKESELASAQTELDSVQAENLTLKSENDELSQKYLLLVQDKSVLEANIARLNNQISSLQSSLDQKRAEYDALVASTSDDSAKLQQYEWQLASYQSQLAETQAQLEQMLGVKAQIIESLSTEFRVKGISVEVDKQTGALTLSGGALFDTGSIELKESGERYLDSLLPVYFGVLLSDQYRQYVAEIVIEGHTDSTGKAGAADAFLYNLELSQQRALAVSNYILSGDYMTYTLRLNASEQYALRSVISASGRSYSARILNANGTENKEASRRVEIKFRLKDDSTINATQSIFN